MKQKTVKQRFVKLTIMTATTILLMPVFLLFSFKSKLGSYSDFWKQLGVSEKNATNNIRESFLYGYLQYGGARNIKNIALGDRKAVTTDLLNYTKTYVQSAEFKKSYEAERQNMKPREVTKKPRTEEQIRQDQIQIAKDGMARMENGLKTATGDMKKVFEDSYQMFKKQLAEYENPNNEIIKLMAEGEKSSYENELKLHAEKVKKWEQNYPAESSRFIKLRLQELLKATANIDYGAQLVEKGDKKYFVKKEYESKHPNWKMGFRAGKEVTETVRVFVQAWVQE